MLLLPSLIFCLKWVHFYTIYFFVKTAIHLHYSISAAWHFSSLTLLIAHTSEPWLTQLSTTILFIVFLVLGIVSLFLKLLLIFPLLTRCLKVFIFSPSRLLQTKCFYALVVSHCVLVFGSSFALVHDEFYPYFRDFTFWVFHYCFDYIWVTCSL